MPPMINEEPTEDESAALLSILLSGQIAKEMGWNYNKIKKIWERGDEKTQDSFPPLYTTDLNLCQEFEEELREDEEIIFANILTTLINNGEFVDGAGFRPCPIIFADAATKCYAFAHVRNL